MEGRLYILFKLCDVSLYNEFMSYKQNVRPVNQLTQGYQLNQLVIGYYNLTHFLEFCFLCVYGLKGVFAKNERGYRLNAIKKRF